MAALSSLKNFIAIYDDALAHEVCDDLVERFDETRTKTAKQETLNADVRRKRSVDLAMGQHPEWKDPLEDLLIRTYPFIKDYLCRMRFPLLGAVTPSLRSPIDGKMVLVDYDNWPVYQEDLADEMLDRVYRYGDVILQHYAKGSGGYFQWHSEIFPLAGPQESIYRVLLWMYYLNDVDEGGETEFFYQKEKIQPKKGRLVIAPAGFTHTHRGNIPVSNDKYIATSWVLFNRPEKVYAPIQSPNKQKLVPPDQEG